MVDVVLVDEQHLTLEAAEVVHVDWLCPRLDVLLELEKLCFL